MKKQLAILGLITLSLLLKAPAFAASIATEANSILQIEIFDSSGRLSSWGSGVVIDNQRHILTNEHVIRNLVLNRGYSGVGCLTTDANQPPLCSLRFKVLNSNAGFDLAVLEVTEVNSKAMGWMSVDEFNLRYGFTLSPVSFDRNSLTQSVSLGDRIQALGYPGAGGETITLTQGIVSGFNPINYNGQSLPWQIKTDAKINPGNSGGGAFDSAGNFIGVPEAVAGGDGNIGYIISLPVVNAFLSITHLPINPVSNPEGVYHGYTNTNQCSPFSDLDTSTNTCRCHDGFYAVGNSCILGNTYCSIKGTTYDQYRHICNTTTPPPSRDVATIQPPVTTPLVSNTQYSIPTPTPSQPSCASNQELSTALNRCICKSGYTPNQSGVCVSQDDLCVNSHGSSSYFDVGDNTCHICPANTDLNRSTHQCLAKIPPVVTPKPLIGTVKTKTDLLKCSVVGKKANHLYYLKGSSLIKQMTPVGKECFATEQDAKKKGYKKARV